MRTATFSFFGLMMAAAGCGDDGGSGSPDAGGAGDGGGGTVSCPSMAPDRDRMMGPCCYRASNATRLDDPELRLAAVKLTSPPSVNNVLVQGLLQDALDREVFSWLMLSHYDAVAGSATIQTGYGRRNMDGTYSFNPGMAPPPGAADRWDPITLTGTVTGETFMAPALNETLTVPVFDETGTMVTLELPLRNLEIVMATLTEDRSCVGRRRSTTYDTSAGEIGGYLAVEDTTTVPLVVGTTIDTTLCMFVAGMSAEMGNCSDFPQGDWMYPPDSVCNDMGCTTGGCDAATTCNAWRVGAEIAAHGVEITP